MALTVRTLLSQSAPYASSDFIAGLSAAGVAVDAPVPMKDASFTGSVALADLVATIKEMGGHLARGEKIQAIKVLRALTNLGLKETKDLIDLFPVKPYSPPY
jgi:ribosomal protein L7/L12